MSEANSNVKELDEEEMKKINGGAKKGKEKSSVIYKCNFCGEEFDDKKKLKKHVENFHK